MLITLGSPKPITINQLDIPTSLTNEQITDGFADPRVINITQ
jgi:hypothetical protein